MGARQEVQRIGAVGTNMRGLLAALSIGCSLLAGSAAWAATVQPVKGDVSVNQGEGFKKLAAAFDVKAGDAVMVSPGGSAKVSYADGCAIELKPGAVMVIAALSPCASGSYAQEDDQNNDHHDDWGKIAVGAGVAGGTGFVIYEIIQNNNNQGQNNNNQGKPASP
jgi:hypothetical protein